MLKSKRLNKAVDDFAIAMKARLAEKEKQGYRGWDKTTQNQPDIGLAIAAKTKLQDMFNPLPSKSIDIHATDIANYMMMLWYRYQKANRWSS